MIQKLVRVASCALLIGLPLAQFAHSARADDTWKAGTARADITPREGVMLLGYPDRKGVSSGVESPIFAKALALEDSKGHRSVLLTTDMVGLQRPIIADPVAERVMQKTGLPRSAILMNASHSHTGPVVTLKPLVRKNVAHGPMTSADAEKTATYSRELNDKLVDVMLRALDNLSPARLAWGAGQVAFPVSRRTPNAKGLFVMDANLMAPVDRSVPVLRVSDPAGKPRAVVFGCACHAVAAGSFNKICADYPGYAQDYIERRHPGAQAMFLAGCGADANPYPFGTVDLAKSHGGALGGEVCRVLTGELQPLTGPLETAFEDIELPLAQYNPDELGPYLDLPNFQAQTARQMLDQLKAGHPLDKTYRAPFAVWQFGGDLTLVALPSEPVSEHVTLISEALGAKELWISGYNNDFFGYLPTARVIKEGGHEAIGVTQWALSEDLASRVGFFDAKVQDAVLDVVKRLSAKAGRSPAN